MGVTQADLAELVSLERGEIDRRIFSDPEIFERELELIFGRAWQFMCHESQIRDPGDFVEVPIGRDNVLVVRQRDHSIRALLNTCAHRGNAVCRAEEGNTRNFMCTYHGWTYDLAGRLVGVPGLKTLYKGELDRTQHGLRQAAQVDSYRGFVFVTLDPGAPTLRDYLGFTCRLALDLLTRCDEVEVVPGIQKFTVPCNWKFPVDNLFDWYHPQVTHMSANIVVGSRAPKGAPFVDAGGATTPDGRGIDAAAGQLTLAADSIVVLGEYGHAISGPNRAAHELLASGPMTSGPAAAIYSQSFRDAPAVREALGEAGSRVAGHPNVFPNTWVSTPSNQISLRIPISPSETEIWWYTFVPVEAAPEYRAAVVSLATHAFGPAGLFEQEDGENWMQSTLQASGTYSRTMPHLLKMNLGGGAVQWDDGLAYIEGQTNEHAQLWLYHCWQQWMSGCDWSELADRTRVPEVI